MDSKKYFYPDVKMPVMNDGLLLSASDTNMYVDGQSNHCEIFPCSDVANPTMQFTSQSNDNRIEKKHTFVDCDTSCINTEESLYTHLLFRNRPWNSSSVGNSNVVFNKKDPIESRCEPDVIDSVDLSQLHTLLKPMWFDDNVLEPRPLPPRLDKQDIDTSSALSSSKLHTLLEPIPLFGSDSLDPLPLSPRYDKQNVDTTVFSKLLTLLEPISMVDDSLEPRPIPTEYENVSSRIISPDHKANKKELPVEQCTQSMLLGRLPEIETIDLDVDDINNDDKIDRLRRFSLSLLLDDDVDETTVSDDTSWTGQVVGIEFESRLRSESNRTELSSALAQIKMSQKRLKVLMQHSRQTQRMLQEWDRDNGLPLSHSYTMMHTNRSRKQLDEGRIIVKSNTNKRIGSTLSRVDCEEGCDDCFLINKKRKQKK